MRTTTIYTLAAFLILTAPPKCYSQPQVQMNTGVNRTHPRPTSLVHADALDPRWSELTHTDTEFVPRRYDSLETWQKHREHLRRQILWAAGLWPIPEKTPLRARIFGRIEHDDYTVEKVYFESIPGLFVTGNLYRPLETSLRSHPGVLNPHGHAKTGRLHDDKIASYQARCITFARMGCVAFMWDMIEYNDSAMQLQGQYQEKNYWNVHNAPWKHERNRRMLWNVNALGIQLWNSIRALDFLSSLPEVDLQRLACTGESGGGTQTFLLAAIDDRVKVAAPVCMVSSYMQGGCNCENAPVLRIDTHNTEFAAVMAPRPMMLVSVTGDWTSHTPEVEMPVIKSIYELYGSEGKLAHAHFDTGHGYNLDMRNAVYPWFARWLSLPVSDNFSESPYSVEDVDDLLVFKESVPDRAIRDHETLVERMIDSAKRRLDRYKPLTAELLTEDRRIFGEGLWLSVGASSFKANDISYEREGDFEFEGLQGERGVIIGSRRGVRIPVWVFRQEHQSETLACALLVHGEGRAALARKQDLLRGLLAAGQMVYIIEPFGIGDARADDDLAKQRGTTRYFTTFNRTDDAERVYDILVAIAYCRWHGTNGKASLRVNTAGFGKAGPWLAIAGSVIGPEKEKDIKFRFAIDANRFDTSSEEQYLKLLFIPGVLRAGGLPNAVALITPHVLFLQNAGNRFDTSMVKAACALRQAEGKPAEVTMDSAARDDVDLLEFMTRASAMSRAPVNQRNSPYFPPPDSEGGWRTLDSPERIHRIAGLDQKKLDEAFEMIQGSTKNGGLLVIRRGWLVYERYFGLGHREATPNLASCGKSFTSVAVGILVGERSDLFPEDLNQKVFTPRYFPPEAFPLTDPRKKDIQLGQLLTFSAGIRGNNPGNVHGKEVMLDPAGPDGWYALVDETTLGLKDAKYRGKLYSTKTLWCDPGSGYSYATASIHLASIMLRHVTGMELQEYVDQRLAGPMGWGRWGFAYKYAREVTHTPGGGGIALRATDMLRFGYLLLNEGRWGDRQLVPADYVRQCGHKSLFNTHFPYSLQFNVNTDGDVPELPRDAFWKSGSGGHALYVVPSLDLVVWKLGGRDGQYSKNDTGLAPHPAAIGKTTNRKGWKETVDKQVALHQTLELVVDAIRDELH